MRMMTYLLTGKASRKPATWAMALAMMPAMSALGMTFRDCTVYEYKMGSVTARYSIDNEYDLCLKYEATTAEVTSIFIFTKAEIGTVETEEVLAYLDDYEIDDYRNII